MGEVGKNKEKGKSGLKWGKWEKSYVVKSKASPHLTSPHLTSPHLQVATSGYKWLQVVTSGFMWLKVVLCH